LSLSHTGLERTGPGTWRAVWAAETRRKPAPVYQKSWSEPSDMEAKCSCVSSQWENVQLCAGRSAWTRKSGSRRAVTPWRVTDRS